MQVRTVLILASTGLPLQPRACPAGRTVTVDAPRYDATRTSDLRPAIRTPSPGDRHYPRERWRHGKQQLERQRTDEGVTRETH